MKRYYVMPIASLILMLVACDTGPNSPRGFSLPQGDFASGEQVFIRHQCQACHSLSGEELADIKPDIEKRVMLGGESSKVTTYAELVTSIINPSHKIARSYKLNTKDESDVSKMRNYNDVMTVTELVDLVTYLQPHYKVKPHEYTTYGRYY